MTLGLVLDTTLRGVAASVVKLEGEARGSLVAKAMHATNAGSIQMVSSLVQGVLRDAGVKIGRLAGFAVASGPGSFTGIKVGLAFAHGFQAAHPALMMCGLSSLDALSDEVARTRNGGVVACFLPATKTHGFVAVRGGLGISELLDASSLSSIERLSSRIPDGSHHVVVEGWPLLETELGKRGLTCERLPMEVASERALIGLSHLAASAWPHNFDASRPMPRYLRLSTAEERLAEPAPIP